MGIGKSRYMMMDDAEVAEFDAEKLRDAMKGLGTNHSTLIRILAFKDNNHLRNVNRVFQEKYGTKGDLLKWIRDDTSGDYLQIMVAMAEEEAEMIADALYRAMKGMGTDDDLLINTLATRSPTEISKSKAIFERKYPGESLESWLRGDTSGDYMKVLLALMDKTGYYCRLIHEAISGAGTNDDDLIRAIVSLKQHDSIKKIVSEYVDSHGFALDLLTELEGEFSTPTLKEVAKAYEVMYHEPLHKAVASDVSGKYGKLIMGLLTDQANRDAEYIHSACVGAGTNDDKLIEILVTRGAREREAIAERYASKFGKTLADEIKSETSFNYKQALLALSRPKSVVIAEAIQKACKGMGTDDRALIYLVAHRSKKELKEIAAAYESLYGKDIVDVLDSETSGWYCKTLLYLFKMAKAEKEIAHMPYGMAHRVKTL